jgi:hypothetical protein
MENEQYQKIASKKNNGKRNQSFLPGWMKKKDPQAIGTDKMSAVSTESWRGEKFFLLSIIMRCEVRS